MIQDRIDLSIHLSLFYFNVNILVTFMQICNFNDPNLVTFYLCIYLILNK